MLISSKEWQCIEKKLSEFRINKEVDPEGYVHSFIRQIFINSAPHSALLLQVEALIHTQNEVFLLGSLDPATPSRSC